MDSFCGNDSFWNFSAAWEGDWPHLTRCFQNTVLALAPRCMLWVTAVAYFPWMRYKRQEVLPYNWLFWAKQTSGAILLTMEALRLLFVIVDGLNHEAGGTALSDVVAAGVQALTTALVLSIVAVERYSGVHSSAILFLYWLVIVMVDLVPFYTILLEQSLAERLVTSAVFYVTFTLELSQLGLHCFAHVTLGREPGSCPETSASFLSWITYSWMSRKEPARWPSAWMSEWLELLASEPGSPGSYLASLSSPSCQWASDPWMSWLTLVARLMSTGYRRELHESDIFDLKPCDTTAANGPVLLKTWLKEHGGKKKASQRRTIYSSVGSGDKDRASLSEKTPLLSAVHLNQNCSLKKTASIESAGKTRHGYSSDLKGNRKVEGPCGEAGRNTDVDSSLGRPLPLWWALLKTYAASGVLSNVWKLPHEVLAVLNPLLLGEMIDLSEDDSRPSWRSFVLAGAIGISLVLQALLFHLTFHLSMTLGLRVKAALTAAIFNKVTTISNEGHKRFPQGEIVNLVSVDTQHVNIFVSFLPYAWSGPVQLALSLYFLYRTVGPSAFAGAGVLLALLPANAWLLSRLGTLQGILMETKDSRLKLVSELLTAIKAVKVNSWEEAFEGHVAEVRERELQVLRKVALLDASQTVVWGLTPLSMSLLIFTTHALAGQDHRVTSEAAFVTLAYLSILRGVVTVAPMVMTDIIKAGVSVKRLERFLRYKDLDKFVCKRDASQDAVIVMDKATFSRESGAEPCLKNISLRVADGSLTAVVGAVGSGKTSLLLSILGELHLQSGHVVVNTAASYLPQHPWLRQASIRDNVVGQHNPFNKTRYDVALRVCFLTSDIQAMAAGDLTEVGDKGMTLSGGQRQRVSLARAVYETRDLYLLDDPLSALDGRVGRQIFRQLIGQEGLLRDSTRLVVTSTYDWLPEADVILVLANGCVVEEGSYHSLLSRGGLFATLVGSRTARDINYTLEESKITRTFSGRQHRAETRFLWSEEQLTAKGNPCASLQDLVKVPSVQPGASHWGSGLPTREEALEEETGSGQVRPDDKSCDVRTSRSRASSRVAEDSNSPLSLAAAVAAATSSSDSSDEENSSDRLRDQRLMTGRKEESRLCRRTTQECGSSRSKGCGGVLQGESGDDWSDFTAVTSSDEDTDTLTTVVSQSFGGRTRSEALASNTYDGCSLTLTGLSGSLPPEALTSMSCEPLTKGHVPNRAVVCEERVHVGKVPWRIYGAILRGVGLSHSVVMITFYVLYHAASVSANVWLARWTDNEQLSNLTSLPSDSNERYYWNTWFLGVYGSLGFVQCVLLSAYAFSLALRRVHASRDIHAQLLRSLLHAPITFFHQNPPARVLNRMSRDLEVVDTEIWLSLEVTLDSLCHVISTCVIIAVSMPYFLLVLLPVTAVYYFVQRYYVTTSRQLRRLEARSRSPVFAHLSDMAGGAVVLRSGGARAVQHAAQQAGRLTDSSLKLAFAGNTASRWLGVRMGALGVTIVGVTSSLSVVFRRALTSGIVGLTVSYALDVTDNLNWLVRMTGDLETDAASIERIDEYSQVVPESKSRRVLQPAHCWPLLGRVQFLNVSARYSPQAPWVLRAINFTIQPGEKVGVVGRTGAGKTSLWSVLIGLLRPTDGAVVIDGLDVCTVPLHVLRNRVGVLPQEPFVLEGTIKMNLDLTGHTSEGTMWEALRKTRLDQHVRSLPKGLDTPCQSDGSIFSGGQKQLLCLARLLLRQARVVVLDEPTATVDAKTAAVIERTLFRACASCTVIVVAHRLSTVMNCSRVIVMDQGSVVEIDSPSRLLANPLSAFSRLAASSGF